MDAPEAINPFLFGWNKFLGVIHCLKNSKAHVFKAILFGSTLKCYRVMLTLSDFMQVADQTLPNIDG